MQLERVREVLFLLVGLCVYLHYVWVRQFEWGSTALLCE